MSAHHDLKMKTVYAVCVVCFAGFLCAQPVAHWTFDGDLTDAAGGNDGVFSGAEAPLFVAGPDGAPSSALFLDGVDDHVQVPDDELDPRLALTQPFTLALWFKSADVDQQERYLLSRHAVGGGGQYAIIYGYTAQHVDFFAPSRNFGDDPRAGGISEMHIPDTEWHHIAYTYDGINWCGYLDGGQMFSHEISFALSDGFFGPWWIGSAHATANYVHGVVDDVRIYTEALDSDAVAALYFEPVVTTCPEEGDTYLTDLHVDGPEDFAPGTYMLTADAYDESDDSILYTFVLDNSMGSVLTVGPQDSATAAIDLSPGTWIVTVTVDDDPACDDTTEDAELTDTIEVVYAPVLLGRWPFDGDLTDAAASNDGLFFGDAEPLFVDGHDGTPEGAIQLDGIDDYVQIPPTNLLALSEQFTLALWFRPEHMDQAETYLLSRNDSIPGGSGKQYAMIYEYTDNSVDFYSNKGHIGDNPRTGGQSVMPLEEAKWHHIAYAYDGEAWSGYVDGEQVFSIPLMFTLDNTFSSSWWIGAANPLGNNVNGAFDDVRIYNYGLTEEEIADVVSGGGSQEGWFLRGETNGDGQINIADGIFILGYLFAGGQAPACEDAADANDDGSLNIADVVVILGYLFGGAEALPEPFETCGPDPTDDPLTCMSFPGCE